MTVTVSGFKLNSELWNSLRTCQRQSIERAFKYLRRPLHSSEPKSCLISLPTGAGKTGVISLIAHKSTQSRVLVLCHRRAVCDQLYRQVNGGFFRDRVSSHSEKLKHVHEDVTDMKPVGVWISTFQKLLTLTPQQLDRLKESIDLIIVDEGHSEPSPVWKGLVRGASAHKIVITATPYRNDLFQFDIDEHDSYIYTFTEAIKTKIISEPSFEQVTSGRLVDQISCFLSKHEDSKCIVKCKSLSDIEYYYNLLNPKFNVLAIHDQFVNDARANVKVNVPANLGKSDYQVIIHQRKIDEGVDIPQAKLLILTYTVGSGRELVQTVGRIVRVYRDYAPKVFELEGNANKLLWENYLYFDKSLSTEGGVKKFISSLDSSKLIEVYLESFPDASYYGNRFLRKFDINEFDPSRSIVIPTASVCFLYAQPKFDVNLAADLLYWRSNQGGELARVFDCAGGSKLVLSIAFNKSRFLSDQFFFEPTLELTLLKTVGADVVAIYDSRGRRFTFDTELRLGKPVPQGKLLNVMALGARVVTKEATSRSIGTANRRPESMSMKGRDLEKIPDLQRNSSYRVSNLKFDNFDLAGGKQGSYYIGVDSGRISDQQDGLFTLDTLSHWLDSMGDTLSDTKNVQSNFVHSFARPIPVDIRIPIESVIFDFTDLPRPLFFRTDKGEVKIDNSFLYFNRSSNISLDPNCPKFEIDISLCSESPYVKFVSNIAMKGDVNNDITDTEGLNTLLLHHLHKILLADGVSYASGSFYQIQLPTSNSFEIANSNLANVIIGLPELLNKSLDEKGYVKGAIKVSSDGFGEKSIFHMLDLLKNVSLTDPKYSQLGPFIKYIPDVDLVFCTDMDTEPADFILSSPTKLIYAHVKCGTSATRPQSPAGGLAEVGGQAIKNMEMLISHDINLKAANWSHLVESWPTANAAQKVPERIRLYGLSRFEAKDQAEREQKVEEVWDTIAHRRRSNTVQKEIWIVAGNSFSADYFETQLRLGAKAAGESLQAYQLIQSWLATASSNDVELKIFVSKKPVKT